MMSKFDAILQKGFAITSDIVGGELPYRLTAHKHWSTAMKYSSAETLEGAIDMLYDMLAITDDA